MAETTPTGIPIEDCATCNRHHPVTRKHCTTCGLALIFRCAQSDCGNARGGTDV
ncbi:uncharacterized protein PD653_4920 [Nocardioides sp. PD653]|nr:uncharacterized protein PD653_4920 [Nocardioides sp. PD653]